jgi:hypothetical protein
VRAKIQDFKGAIADCKEAMGLQPTSMSFGERVSIQSQIIDLENAISDTRRMADALTIVPFGRSQSVVADGRIVKFDLGS